MKMRATGFTLIELMVTVTIVAILTAIALPSYRTYVLKSHRTVAINALMNLASQQARFYTTNNTYATNLTTLGYTSNTYPIPDANSHYYDLSVTAANATSFTLQAAPVGNQANDTCGNFTYTDLGVKGVNGTASVQDCWVK